MIIIINLRRDREASPHNDSAARRIAYAGAGFSFKVDNSNYNVSPRPCPNIYFQIDGDIWWLYVAYAAGGAQPYHMWFPCGKYGRLSDSPVIQVASKVF